jgi:hypothetical protein
VNACICNRSLSRITHHGWRSVADLVSTPKCVGVGLGLTVYMIQCGGRGGISPKQTFSLFDSGRELSYCVTAIIFGSCICEIIALNVGVSSNFVECGSESFPTALFEEVRNAP